MRSRVCLFVLLLSLMTTIYGQGEKKPRAPEDYVPRTLQQSSTLLPPTFAAELARRPAGDLPDVIVHSDLLPSRVKVLYEGTTRPLNKMKKDIIQSWAHQFAGMVESYTVPYQTEMLFTENGENYWLAVRTESLPKFEQELNKGDAVELFIIKMGNLKLAETDNKLEPVLLVERFAKQ
jgi:hypothetical protein